jgi:hypothetical protein
MRRSATRNLLRCSLTVTLVTSWLAAGCREVSDPTAPTGGQPLQLDAAVFASDIEPILQQRGCSNVACHGGQGSGELLLSGGLDTAHDFTAVGGFVIGAAPADSPLLRKPLATSAGGSTHAGGDIFVDVGDDDYQRLLAWISGEEMP